MKTNFFIAFKKCELKYVTTKRPGIPQKVCDAIKDGWAKLETNDTNYYNFNVSCDGNRCSLISSEDIGPRLPNEKLLCFTVCYQYSKIEDVEKIIEEFNEIPKFYCGKDRNYPASRDKALGKLFSQLGIGNMSELDSLGDKFTAGSINIKIPVTAK